MAALPAGRVSPLPDGSRSSGGEGQGREKPRGVAQDTSPGFDAWAGSAPGVLLNYLVGGSQQRFRDGEAEGPTS